MNSSQSRYRGNHPVTIPACTVDPYITFVPLLSLADQAQTVERRNKVEKVDLESGTVIPRQQGDDTLAAQIRQAVREAVAEFGQEVKVLKEAVANTPSKAT